MFAIATEDELYAVQPLVPTDYEAVLLLVHQGYQGLSFEGNTYFLADWLVILKKYHDAYYRALPLFDALMEQEYEP